MRNALIAILVLAPALARADPRSICIESTIRAGAKTLSSPTVLALDGLPTSVTIASDDLTLKLAITARLRSGRVALDIAYDEKTRGVGTWTTRSLSTQAVVADHEPVTIALPGRSIVITPTTATTVGPCRIRPALTPR